MPNVNYSEVRNAQRPNGYFEATDRIRRARARRLNEKKLFPKRCPTARQPFSFGDGVKQKSKPVEKQPLVKLAVHMPGVLRSSSTKSIQVFIHEDTNVAKLSINFEKTFGLSQETTVDLFCCMRDLQDEALKCQREDYARKEGLRSVTTTSAPFDASSQVSVDTEWHVPSTFAREDKDTTAEVPGIKDVSKDIGHKDSEDMGDINAMDTGMEEELILMEQGHPTPRDDESTQELSSLPLVQHNNEHVSIANACFPEPTNLQEKQLLPTPRSCLVVRKTSFIAPLSPHAALLSRPSSPTSNRFLPHKGTPVRTKRQSPTVEWFGPSSPRTPLSEARGDSAKESSVEGTEEGQEPWDDRASVVANVDSARSTDENTTSTCIEIAPAPKIFSAPPVLDDPDVDMLHAYFCSLPKEKRPDILLEGHDGDYRNVPHDPRVKLTVEQVGRAMFSGVDDNIIDRQKFARWVSHRNRTDILDQVYTQWMARWSAEYRAQKQVPSDEQNASLYSFRLSPLRRMRKCRRTFAKRNSKEETPSSEVNLAAEPSKEYLRQCGWMLMCLMRAGFSQPLLLTALESEQLSRVVDSLVNGLLQDDVLSAAFKPATNAENVRDAVTRVIWLCLMLSTEQRKDFKGRRIWNREAFLKCGQMDCMMKRDMVLVLYKNIVKCPF